MDGILPLWKPKGMTSHDCVYVIRRLLRIKKVGHTGTLDPEVEGVLPICIGQATKISSIIMDSQKVYEAEVCLGISTDTEDQEGKVVERVKVMEDIKIEDINYVLRKFTGDIEQIPPMYSAVKVKGKKLYEYARQGIEVDRPSRTVKIHSIELLSNQIENSGNGTVKFRIRVACSKGTYIRTLCVDIGKSLGFPAHMSHLIRTESGSFTQNEAISIEEVEELVNNGTIQDYIKPIDYALHKFDVLTINDEEKNSYLNGQVLPLPDKIMDANPFRIKTEAGELLALYQQHPTKPLLMKPYKMFSNHINA